MMETKPDRRADRMPLVSVIIPAYNAARTITATLNSALHQNYANLEFVIVDDGSIDETSQIVQAMAAGDDRIRLNRTENGGPMRARNIAIAQARGEFIAPLDADDLWHPAYIEKLVPVLTANANIAFAYALHRTIDSQGRIIGSFPDFGCEGPVLRQHLLVNFVGAGGSAMVMRKSLVDEQGGYDLRTRDWGGAEDYLLQLKLAAYQNVGLVNEYLVGYRKHAGSYSSDSVRMARARLHVLKEFLDNFPDLPRSLYRWNKSEAHRVAAAKLLAQKNYLPAMRLALSAVICDPFASLCDFLLRMRNFVLRARRNGNPSELVGTSFTDADIKDGRQAGIDPITRRRLALLRKLDLWDREKRAAG